MRPKEMKKQAMERLSDSWGQAVIIILAIIVIYLVFMLLEMSVYCLLQFNGLADGTDYRLFSGNSVVTLISFFRLVLGFMVIAPALIGAKWWYLHTVRGEQNGVRSMFVCYANPRIYLKTLAVKSIVTGIYIVAGLPLIFCGYVIYRLLDGFSSEENNQTFIIIMAFFAAMLLVCLGLLYLLFTLKFALVDYLYVLNPDLRIRDIIKASERAMKNSRRPLIELMFSFMGWLLLCTLIFPILFVIPYFAMSYTVCINRIIIKNKILDRNMLLVREPKPAR